MLTLFDRFDIIKEMSKEHDLKHGTIRYVFEQRDVDGASVVIKAPNPKYTYNDYPLELEGFLNTLSNNPHPNLLIPEFTTHTYLHQLAELYPFCDSPTIYDIILEDKIEELNLSDAELAKIACDLLSAAAHISSLGFVHCDIKPSNIFLTLTKTSQPKAMLFDYDHVREPGLYPRPLFDYNLLWDHSVDSIGDYVHFLPLEARRPTHVRGDDQSIFMLDERFMVYQIGVCLMRLTHFQHLIYLEPFSNFNPDLISAVKRAIATKDERFASIGEMQEALSQFL